ncbi:helix-turn-helix domain-containing protein [Mycolicibacter sinensis]|uniref:Helix-turn-helix domain-containing protein n=1 Tax=Mycolicibacter sinensis (strain JDM601) TaxID=875328 RepID=A0A1A2E161_MYCSD|nr:helix-turn-helix domain-containing protein [Mycolicibacter sinensis]OBF98876.1 hypothetical protein A5772_13595 [Mycolicibacter sinensis]OBG00913.1 hypothetical protein A5771_17760 [Mycolicibacter sinensis]
MALDYETADSWCADVEDEFIHFPGWPRWLFGRVRPSAVLTYTAMFWHEWADTRPKVNTIAAMIGVSESTVRRSIHELERAGLLRVYREVDQDGRSTRNRYVAAEVH